MYISGRNSKFETFQKDQIHILENISMHKYNKIYNFYILFHKFSVLIKYTLMSRHYTFYFMHSWGKKEQFL